MFDRILIAVDGSPYSAPAVSATVEVATKFQSQVFVLHVREHDRGRAGAFPLETPQEATQLVAETVVALRHAGIAATGEVHGAFAGHAAREIVDTARSQGADLIVMGSRGLSDIGGLFVGSVTHKVLQLAHVPVLVVRPPEVPAEKREAVAATAVGPVS
ncbi:MAG TPA: universal stress protein [Candidatus Dormibacteraeota bacterium]|nr:universal stress protein [Candidatus Dormibacteraeota bacterium]